MTTYPFSPNYESFQIDTQGGCLNQTVPGATYSPLGPIDTYVIQIQGYYSFKAIATFQANTANASVQPCLQIIHVDSTGTPVSGPALPPVETEQPAANYNGVGNTWTLETFLVDSCGVGDIIFALASDLTGASTGVSQVSNDSRDGQFAGFLIAIR